MNKFWGRQVVRLSRKDERNETKGSSKVQIPIAEIVRGDQRAQVLGGMGVVPIQVQMEPLLNRVGGLEQTSGMEDVQGQHRDGDQIPIEHVEPFLVLDEA